MYKFHAHSLSKRMLRDSTNKIFVFYEEDVFDK